MSSRECFRSIRHSRRGSAAANGGSMLTTQARSLDAAGRPRSPATMPGYHAGRPPRNKGIRYPADPPRVEEIVAVMRKAGMGVHGARVRGLIVVLWRAGLRISEALDLAERDLEDGRAGPAPDRRPCRGTNRAPALPPGPAGRGRSLRRGRVRLLPVLQLRADAARPPRSSSPSPRPRTANGPSAAWSPALSPAGGSLV